MGSLGEQFDVIVVGAGVMGSSAAYQLAKRGKKVLLLEQFDFLHHCGSSHGESRTLRATYPEAFYPAMVMESVKLWQEAESEIGYKVYFKTKQLDMGPTDDASLLAVVASCQLNSIPHRVLNPRQLLDEFSDRFQLPESWVAVVTEVGGVIKPTKAVSMYQTLALRYGAVLKDNMEVTGIEKDGVNGGGGGLVVSTVNGETFWGHKCVVTAGAWTKKLVQRVRGMALPIEAVETNVLYWRIKEEHEAAFTIAGGFPTFASYGRPYIYGTPALEYPGLIKIPLHGGVACDPGRRAWREPAPATLESVREWIRGTFGERVDAAGPAMTQSCLYSMTPDEDFVIDFLGGELGEDVVVAGGFSGHGFKMAPAVGRIVADMVMTGEAQGVELQQFELGRFGRNPKGNVKSFQEQVGIVTHH
ncbi:probable sarcosine oxidase [Diospyros lotus]|uniref:probable sarcosine oxidase n=1 Tax=Diospyros lotus TaxID=55363 RepID=UPI0022518213|nr:probable sarcosine oxidase [Diospyros lotus]